MPARNPLLNAPPYEVEQTLRELGQNLRTARLRRKLTLEALAARIGVHKHTVADAEKGKASTGIVVYAALLWALGLLDQMAGIAAPERDAEGQALAVAREGSRARAGKDLSDEF